MSEQTTAPLSVAVLGTGIMGAAMARNIARAGHRVTAWNRTPDKAAPLAADGITVAGSAAEAVAGADAVVTVLFDGDSVGEVMRGLLPHLDERTVWLQMTTAGPEATSELARLAGERGVPFVDAPVMGTRGPAEAGELTVLAAGSSSTRELAARVFDAVGSRTVWVGEDPAEATASRLKLVANSWVVSVANAAGEIVALSEALDVDPRTFLDLIAGGPLDTPYLRAKMGLILEGRFSPAQFGAATAGKDARLMVEAAERAGVRVDALAAASDRLARVSRSGHAGEDMAAAYFAGRTGTE